MTLAWYAIDVHQEAAERCEPTFEPDGERYWKCLADCPEEAVLLVMPRYFRHQEMKAKGLI